jgi:tetratricopeptide (TPR) repeat protein
VPRATNRQPKHPARLHEPEEVWLEDDPGVGRARSSPRRRVAEEVRLPEDVVGELAAVVGREQVRDLADKIDHAARAYSRDRYLEALRITRFLVDRAPGSATVRELHGLVCYRLGHWREAASQLEAARVLAGEDPSQLPVIMDCRRALGQHRRVEELWKELRSTSPPPDVLAEGRLVLAAQRADRGELDSAIELLVSARAGRNLRRPAERHLRQWYLLADLYERAGDLSHARELFSRVARVDPELADVEQRLFDLGRSGTRDSRKFPSRVRDSAR